MSRDALEDPASDTQAIMAAIPDWVFQLRSKEALAYFIVSTVATWFVSSIFGLWDAVLGVITTVYMTAANVVWTLSNTLAGILGNAYLVVDFIDWVAFQVEGVLLQLGLLAPIAATVAWVSVIVLLAVLANFVVGLVATYLPVRSLPFIGGLFK